MYKKKNMNKITLAILVSSASLIPFALVANEINLDKNIVATFEKIEVIGTRLSSQTTQSYDIDGMSYQSLVNDLAKLPAIQVNLNSGAGSINEVYLRGSDPNYTLVTLNGIPLNDGTNSRGGIADLSLVDNFFIDRVDVANGAKSAVYGSQAVSGVINFVAQPSKQMKPTYEMFLGADTIQGFSAGVGAQFDQFMIKALTKNAGETYEGSQLEHQGVLMVASPTLASGNLDITLMANKGEAESFRDDSGGYEFAEVRELELRKLDDINVGINYTHLLENLEWVTSSYYQKKTELVDSPSIAPGERDPYGYPASIIDNELTRGNISSYVRQQGQKIDWLAGIEYTKEEAQSIGDIDFGGFGLPTDFEQNRETISLFSEVDFAITDSLSAKVAGRYDDTDTDNVFMPSASVYWTFLPNQQVSLDWGKGFKLPSFYALSHPIIGNTELKSEHSQTWQFNYTFYHGYGQFSASLFDYDFDNLIDFDAGPPPKLVNRSKTQSTGGEISFVAKETKDHWQWSINYSYNDLTNSDNTPFLGRAKNKANLTINKGFPAQGVELSLTGQYSSGVYGSSVPTGTMKLDDTFLLNMNASWQVSPKFSFAVGIQNILNDDLLFTPGNSHHGKYLWTTARYQF